jgi:lipopolysaccharide export system protein LptA
MKIFGSLLLFLSLASSWVCAQTMQTEFGTNETLITCEQGLEYTQTHAIFRGNVQVFNPQMELRCEGLTLSLSSNEVTSILAETNVVLFLRDGRMMGDRGKADANPRLRDSWAIGDRAVYSMTDELIVLTGHVLADTPQFYLMGPEVTFDRRTGKVRAPGNVLVGIHDGSFSLGTNALRSGPRVP